MNNNEINLTAWERSKFWLAQKFPLAGLFAGLVYLDPNFFISVSGSLIGSYAKDYLDSTNSSLNIDEVTTELEKPQQQIKLTKELEKYEIDKKVFNAIKDLDDEHALKILASYNETLSYLQVAFDKLAEFRGLGDILTQPLFRIFQTPAQLYPLFKNFLPYHLISRPELQPIINALIAGKTRQLVIRGLAMSGKSILALQLAMAWLSDKKRSVVYIDYFPTDADDAALKNLNYEKHLIIYDSESLPIPLAPEIAAKLIGLPCRVILCQRCGQSKYAREEKIFMSFIKGRNFMESKIFSGDKLKPEGEKIYIKLGPVGKEESYKLLASNLKVVAPGSFTLTDDGKQAIFELLQIKHGKYKTSLLGLAKAFFLVSLRRYSETIGKERKMNSSTVSLIIKKMKLSSLEKDSHDLNEFIQRVFEETINDNEKNVLRIMKRWQNYMFTSRIPWIAIRAGYWSLYKRDLGTEDFEIYSNLERSGIIIKDGVNEFYQVWHPWQLEVIPDYVSQGERNKWLRETIKWFIENLLNEKSPFNQLENNCHILFSIAKILTETGYFKEVEGLLYKIYDIYDEIEDLGSKASVANNLAVNLEKQHKTTEAKKFAEQALIDYFIIAKNDPISFEPDFASVTNNLGIIFYKLGDLTKAEDLLKNSLDIRKKLFNINPEIYKPWIASLKINLGLILQDLGAFDEASKHFKDSLDLYRQIKLEGKINVDRDLQKILHNYGNFLKQQNQTEEACILLKESLEICEHLVGENPQAHEIGLAETYEAYAIILDDLKNYSVAEKYYNKALEICTRLVHEKKEYAKSILAEVLLNFGLHLEDIDEKNEAEIFLKKSIEIYDNLVTSYPKSFKSNLARALNHYAMFLEGKKNRDEINKLFMRSLNIYRDLVEEMPLKHKAEFAWALNNYGCFVDKFFDLTKARPLFEESYKLYRKLFENYPIAYEAGIAISSYNLGNLLVKADDFVDAEQPITVALENFASLYKKFPTLYSSEYEFTIKLTINYLSMLNIEKQKKWIANMQSQIKEKLGQDIANNIVQSIKIYKNLNISEVHLESHKK